ncbi:MAG: hypothetical protein EXS38_11235 [Opitutus sp.]|nr:hypothetical protein [Opitutus sp.]
MIDEVAKRLHAVPFLPFTILTTDGSKYRVPHPDHALISPRGTRVAVYDDNDTSAVLTALHIVAIRDGRSARARSRV